MLTFEILILIYKLFWHFTSKVFAILHSVSSKYHRMNRYRFLNISAAFEQKILNIEEATAIVKRILYNLSRIHHVSPVKTNSMGL